MPTAVLQRGIPGLAGEPVRVLHGYRWLIAAIAAHMVCGLAMVWAYDLPDKMPVDLYSTVIPTATLVFLGAFALLYPVYVMVFVRPRALTRYMVEDLRENYLTAERLLGALVLIALLPMFISVFTVLKTMIPVTNPHAWDVQFAAWDRLLHGGVHPWRLLQPLLGHPWVTSAINFVYHIWLFVLYVILLWQCFSTRDARLRMQFFLTFVLTWSLLGNLLATVLSSGGPVYYGRLTGLADPYAPLMAYLAQANEVATVWALDVHERLWEAYSTGAFDFGSGISAMPSIHVSAAVLFALFGWRVHRGLGIALTVFAVLILLGSVHLAWHYAIDGYVSIVLTWLIWRAVGWGLDRDPAFSNDKGFSGRRGRLFQDPAAGSAAGRPRSVQAMVAREARPRNAKPATRGRTVPS